MRRAPWYALSVGLLACAVLLGGCGSDSDPGAYPAATANLAVGLSTYSGSTFTPFALGTFSEVTSVQIRVVGPDVYGTPQNPLAIVSLAKNSSGVWVGTVPELPAGPVLTFTASAYNASGALIFAGVTEDVLASGSVAVFIALHPESEGIPFAFPRVISIAYPAAITTTTQARIIVQVSGTPGQTLNYEMLPAPFGGSLSPLRGTVTLPGGSSTANIIVVYSAPARVGIFRQSVRVTNPQSNAVETEFRTRTVAPGGGGVSLAAPIITGLSGIRTGSIVTWTATVTDDKPLNELSYAWSFAQTAGTGGVAFTTANANPGILSGYDISVGGTATLQVTDGDGLSASVSFALVAGQLPGSVVFRPPVAVDDIVNLTINAPLTINLLANDSDPDGDPISIIAITNPLRGTLTNHGDGTVTYTREPGFNGLDGFTYTISDGFGGTATATATIRITLDVNVAPSVEVGVGTSLGTDVTLNDNVTVGDFSTIGVSTTVDRDTTIGSDVVINENVSVEREVVIANGVQVGNNTQVLRNSVIQENVVLAENVVIEREITIGASSTVGAGTMIDRNTVVGDSVQIGNTVTLEREIQLASNVSVGTGASIARNTVVAADTSIGTSSIIRREVQIGARVTIGSFADIDRNTTIGADTTIGNNVVIGRETSIGTNTVIGDNVTIGRNVTIGNNVTIASGVTIPDGATIPSGSTVP